MFRISKRFEFSASHILEGLPEGHPCGRLHGHNYAIEVEVEGDLDLVGFVVDYGSLASLRNWIDSTLDHRHLNDQIEGNPTAELLAVRIYTEARSALSGLVGCDDRWNVSAIRVYETPKTCAEYRPELRK